MVARQGHREFVPLVVGKSVSECRNVVVPVMAVVNAKLILLTTALNLKKSAVQKIKIIINKIFTKVPFFGGWGWGVGMLLGGGRVGNSFKNSK